VGLGAVVFVMAAATRAVADTPGPAPLPSPPPERLGQDELDLQARATVLQGSGARAFGMGGAFLARADDATAASWNPAGLTYLRHPEFSLVWAAMNRLDSVTRAPDGTVKADDRSRGSAPDFLAVTYPIELGGASGAAQLSFQRVIPFTGHRTITRGDTVRTVDSEGGYDVWALGTGLQVSRAVRLGVTLNRWTNGYHRVIERQGGRRPNRHDVDFDFSGWNLNLGVMVSPVETLNLAAVAKTGFTGSVTLRRFRTDYISDTEATQNAAVRDGLALDFPGAVGLGLSWRPRSALTLSADWTRSFWSSGAIRGYFTLPPTPAGGPPPPVEGFGELPYPLLYDASGSGQTDTQQIRVGIEYVLITGRTKIPFRAGCFTDTQYFRAADGEPPRFFGVTAGTGLILGPVLLDVAFVHETGRYYDSAVNEISVTSERLYLSLIYRYGAAR
jgi:hypothetical protein